MHNNAVWSDRSSKKIYKQTLAKQIWWSRLHRAALMDLFFCADLTDHIRQIRWDKAGFTLENWYSLFDKEYLPERTYSRIITVVCTKKRLLPWSVLKPKKSMVSCWFIFYHEDRKRIPVNVVRRVHERESTCNGSLPSLIRIRNISVISLLWTWGWEVQPHTTLRTG